MEITFTYQKGDKSLFEPKTVREKMVQGWRRMQRQFGRKRFIYTKKLPATVIIAKDELRYKTGPHDLKYSWRQFQQVLQDEKNLYFMTSAEMNIGVWIPKRAFVDLDQASQFFQKASAFYETGKTYKTNRSSVLDDDGKTNWHEISYLMEVSDIRHYWIQSFKKTGWLHPRILMPVGSMFLLSCTILMVTNFFPFLYRDTGIRSFAFIVSFCTGALLLSVIFSMINAFLRWLPLISAFRKAPEQHSRVLAFCDTQLVIIGTQGEAVLDWGAISELSQDTRLLQFSTGVRGTYLIPRRAFSSSEEADAFYATAQQFWTEAKSRSSDTGVWPPPPRLE